MPSKLKIAKVIPLYKTKDPALFSDYRPISLLPFYSKILERLMHNRLYNFLTEHNILYMNQFGFRKNYSTFLALMDLVDNISKNIDKGNYSIGIFLDLSKARISTWLATNKLVRNISKTNHIIFTSKGKSYNKNVSNIKIDGNNMQQVNKTKCIGIVIEEHLNWAMHISHNCKKCRHSSKVTIFYPGLCIENSIPFVSIVAPTILHIIMGKFISFTST